ncbi:hypothetical protein [Rhizobium laguerreae]|uniref:hypothetical protein n=1 Tax=Rhizobium laguerreae TaxID=1076926 RepID=UPI001C901BB3|nr:hypothetical protein [Rhizobium laguerreae]MBY3199979.1 hypothetical protein [Rhizobium laguerreae]
METFLALIRSFEIKNKLALMSLAFGGVALVLIANNVWPFASGEIVTAPLAGLATLFGAVVLGVNAFYYIGGFVSSLFADHKAKETAVADRVKLNSDIDANLDTLTPIQQVQLMWIIRNGTQRVDLPIDYGLIQKKIAVQVSRASYQHVDIDGHVWAQRDALLAKWAAVKLGPEFPSRPYAWMA